MAQTILLAIDLNDPESGQTLLSEAVKLLSPGGTLHVVSVLPSMGNGQISQYFNKDYEKEALSAFGQGLADWVRDNVPASVTVRPHVLHGTVYDEVLRAADAVSASLIVIGANRPELQDYLLGPNAARVVRHAKQSVYVVRS